MKSIAVFCGARLGASPKYEKAAQATGKLLAAQGIQIVYGGGNIGLMGALANAALAAGGKVIGVIPEFMVNLEQAHQGLTELIITQTMHERKALIYEKVDAALILPGGLGTLDELFEVLTWGQIGLHIRPVGFYNLENFYTPLLNALNLMTNEGFIEADYCKKTMFSNHDLPNLIEQLKNSTVTRT